jgi:hypothetical protein
MTEPMSDERKAEIRRTWEDWRVGDSDVPDLLAEVDRLRAALSRVTDDGMVKTLTEHFADTFVVDHGEDLPEYFAQEVLKVIRDAVNGDKEAKQ